MNPLFSERQRRRMNPVLDPAEPALTGTMTDFSRGLPAYIAQQAQDKVDALKWTMDPNRSQFPTEMGQDEGLKVANLVGTIGGTSFGLGPLKPAGSIGMFGGRKSVTAPHSKMDEAELMDAAGKGRLDIHETTGVHREGDNLWRYEIPDDKAKLRGALATDLDLGIQRTLGTVLDHPKLYEAYPHLRALKVHNRVPENARGVYEGDAIGLKAGMSPEETLSTLLHELQHGVQQYEGFSPGGSPKMFAEAGPMVSQRRPNETEFEAYERLLGEVEARRVQHRRTMNDQDRADIPPWWSDYTYAKERINPEDIIVPPRRGGLGGLGGR